MKKALISIILLALLLTSCRTADVGAGAVESPATAAGNVGQAEEEPMSVSIFFFTTEGGIGTLESEEDAAYLTIPGLEIVREPVSSYISENGEPIFVSTRNAINIKVYSDALMFMRGNTIEYIPWFFTKTPKEFYYKF